MSMHRKTEEGKEKKKPAIIYLTRIRASWPVSASSWRRHIAQYYSQRSLLVGTRHEPPPELRHGSMCRLSDVQVEPRRDIGIR